jgi:hypothetical protein
MAPFSIAQCSNLSTEELKKMKEGEVIVGEFL